MHRLLWWTVRRRDDRDRLVHRGAVVLNSAAFSIKSKYSTLMVGTHIYWAFHEQTLTFCRSKWSVDVLQEINSREHLTLFTCHDFATSVILAKPQNTMTSIVCHKECPICPNADTSGLFELSVAVL